jgi:serine/threonine protein kinase
LVALKVIKLGMDTKSVMARFAAERQALAMMDHPNIAKVFDAGATETGRPFFVMELVRGIHITDYCDQANLSAQKRLDLFIKVCQAIQHAHQKGIIHRDIKPSNILVTLHDGVPVPKVIKMANPRLCRGDSQSLTIPGILSAGEMAECDLERRRRILSGDWEANASCCHLSGMGDHSFLGARAVRTEIAKPVE